MAEANNSTTNPRGKIEDLKYIVMEGGGARGTVYLGSIKGIEKQMETITQNENDPTDTSLCTFTKRPRRIDAKGVRRKAGIMDYLKSDPIVGNTERRVPAIEGCVGASSGGVTALAIILGLNSEEITEVLEFNFANFISEVDPGKYRMINENGGLAIGEDKSVYPNAQETVFGEKADQQLGGKEKQFKYTLDKDKTKIVGNPVKWAKRELGVSVFIKVLLDGLGSNLVQLGKLMNPKQKDHWANRMLTKFLGMFKKKGEAAATVGQIALARSLQTVVLNLSMFWLLKSKSPVKVSPNIIVAVIKDRGMFSSFQVREFFYDLLLFALTKDTYFQERVILDYNKDFEKEADKITSEIFVNTNDKNKKFTIGKRSEYGFSPIAKVICTKLQDITFREFYALLDIEIAFAVSNFTTNSPLFFSDSFTPDFRVLEAAASSMCLPPAMRPIFNESDVLLNLQENHTEPHITPIAEDAIVSKEVSVMVDGVRKAFVTRKNGKLHFSKSDYELYYYVVRMALQQYMLTELETPVYIDLNNVIELNTSLTLMRDLLVGKRKVLNDRVDPTLKTGKYEMVFEKSWIDQTITLNEITYVVDKALLLFFYNAQFKGMFVDGGYFNNIPFNYLREKFDDGKLKDLIVIKLDGSYPPYFMDEVNKLCEKAQISEEEILEIIESEEFRESIDPSDSMDANEIGDVQRGIVALKRNENFEAIVLQIQAKFDAYTKIWLKDADGEVDILTKRLKKVNRKHILHIIKAWYEQYGKQNHIKPWAIPRPLIGIAFTGYAYGAKRGQIRDPSDHNFIVPLYDMGVDTYDFEMERVATLARASHVIAEKDIITYFTREEATQTNPN